jgi:hypothetical protein
MPCALGFDEVVYCFLRALARAMKSASVAVTVFPEPPMMLSSMVFMHSFCNGHLQHSKPFIYGPFRNVAKLTHFATPAVDFV